MSGCATVCPRTWEVSTTAGHDRFYGESVSSTVSIGGAIGPECRESVR